jgi:tetratricopeptide (TPR) repeat protein
MDMSWRERLEAIGNTASPEARLAFLEAEARLLPDDIDLAFEYGLACIAARKFEAAIGALIPVTRAAGHHLQYRGWLDLAQAFKGLGDFTGAELAYRQAYPIDPGSYWPVKGLAELVRQRNGNNAAEAFIGKLYEPLRPDGRGSMVRYIAAIKAEDSYNAQRAMPDWRIHPPREIPGLRDAVMMLMVKDEDDIIGQNLRHHYTMGFRRFCILDNGSTDGTAGVISAFREAHQAAIVVTIYDPIAGYYQADKMIAAERFCELYMKLGGAAPGWMFFLDADEFLVLTGVLPRERSFDEALKAAENNLLVMHWIHCAAPGMITAIEPGAGPFGLFTRICTKLEPQVPKIAYRSGQGLAPAMGNHFVTEYPYAAGQVINASDFGVYLAHFPMRSLTQARKKVINGGKAYKAASGLDEHGGHWRERYALYEKHGDAVIAQMLANHIRDTR